ncbi:unnamed protein product [Durusdinium trenchii]|uniref:USP domain-containing protein n=1 Tax=Durusdinium trenchii TaxID=1381693 RepID=A0ABP0MHY0_9DINO
MDRLPRAFQNPGQWCWFNALLQALASISDPRWWSLLNFAKDSASSGHKDVLTFLAPVLQHLNREDAAFPSPAEECGMSSISGEQQDAHEAFIKLLESIHSSLCRRQLRSFQQLQAFSVARPCLLGREGLLSWCEATQAIQCFEDLFEGVLEETRVCTACGLARVESCPSKQAFRCLSLDLINIDRPHFSSVNLLSLLKASYSGQPTEEIDGLLCYRCSLEASIRRFLLDCGASFSAGLAFRRFMRLADGLAPSGAEVLEALRPLGAPPCVLRRRSHLRSFRIKVAPRILTFHMRRLIFGPFGFIKVSNPVRYAEILHADDLGLDGGLYSLSSVMSHLGQAHAGHFITHRVWPKGTPLVEERSVPLCTPSGKVVPWFRMDSSLRILRVLWHRDVGCRLFGKSRQTSKVWVCTNDDDVSEVPAWQALNLPAAYLFFYERCESAAR